MDLDLLKAWEADLYWAELYPTVERLFDDRLLPSLHAMVNPVRRYAESVFDNRAIAFRSQISTASALSEFLDLQISSILDEIFGLGCEDLLGDVNTHVSSPGLTTADEAVAGHQNDCCLHCDMVKDALEWRHYHKLLIDPVARVGATEIVIQKEFSKFAGLSARRDLAVAVKPYVQARADYWLAVYSPRTSDRAPDAAPVQEEGLGDPPTRKPVKRRKQHPVNKEIDDMLREIAKARPRSHKEVFETLDRRGTRLSRQRFFQRAGGWLTAYRLHPQKARAWLSQRWTKLGLRSYFEGARDEGLQ